MLALEDPDDAILRVGKRIGQIRREKGITQRQLSDDLGVAVTWISKIETKGSNLGIKTIVRIANALDVEAKELWEPPTA